jgi:hypothetical protein
MGGQGDATEDNIMWEFMKLAWRVECIWSIMLNNKHCSLAELVLRGETDEILQGVSEEERPDDGYVQRLKYLRELIASGKRFLDIVDAEVCNAIDQIQNPYPEANSYLVLGEMPIDEE